ncbi:sugar ABC transporter permease [Thermococcus sp. M39]|uniref:carbohydrate ABC transporter permease n=1 Tax=unclassified Thermococcus TaxID=2627626 RepID=UPI00143BDBAC|nr:MULTISPECIES: sugar ABC transporter permease [unclassified Thermococcus]NJE08141.1 sugar ABC transporter permease [Thermococcus sp. M39]NJE11634.1 sugar ABC transporter permease [Thermococcus sp. LS2]
MRKSPDLPYILLFLGPALILVGIFVYVAVLWNIYISLTDWRGLLPSYRFVGLLQYKQLFHDPVFWTSLKNNILLLLLFVPGSILMGLLLAIMLDRKIKFEGGFRTIYTLPFALSFVVTATLWAWMYDPSSGVLNTLFEKLHLEFLESRWITDPNIAMYCIIIALIWQFSGYTMIIYLAGIRSIPIDHYEAAVIDGASTWQVYRYVVIPQLVKPTLSAFVVLMVFSLKAFDFIWVLTRGGPGTSTFILAIQMYKETFAKTNFAYGAAIATILLLMALAVVLPYLYWSYRGEKE